MSISAKLLHAVRNKLQLIMSWIDIGESENDPEKRRSAFDRARNAIRELARMLEEKVGRKKPPC